MTEIFINGVKQGTFNFEDYIYEYSDIPLHIKANKKLSIKQYNYSHSKDELIDLKLEAQIQVLPTRQMLDSLDLFVLNHFDEVTCRKGIPYTIYDNMYCNIVANKGDSVYLDGELIDGFKEIFGTTYVYKSVLVKIGYHQLKSSKGISAMIYGHRPLEKDQSTGAIFTTGFYTYNSEGNYKRDDASILVNSKHYNRTLCSNAPFNLSVDAPEQTKTFHWTINDTLKVEGKDVDLDLPEAGKYKIKLKLDNDESQIYEWEVTRLEPITSDLDSAIYLCNDSLTFISMNASGGSESKSITWFPANNLKDPTQFHIEFIEPLKKSQTLYYEVIDEYCCTYNDSVKVNITNIYPHLTTAQNNFCEGDSSTISLDKDYEQIVWNTGETTKDIVVKIAGIYSATVTDGECTNSASIEIKVNPLPDFDIKTPNGLLICNGGNVEIEIEADPNISIQWSDNSRVRKRTFSQSGTFSVTAKDIKTGCESSKEIVISDMNEIQADILGNPTFCDGESTTLTLNPEGKSYLWNTGETTRSIEVSESGNYSATITSEAGYEITATKEVTKYPLPDFEILGETIICENPVAIYPNKDFANYEWNTGANSKTITITEAGDYWLRVTDKNGCETTKSVEIKQANPELNLSTNNINFGEILFGSTKTQTITADRDVIITKNTAKFNANINNKNINIIFNPTNIGEYIDTLIVETEGDCKATDTIYITGVCKAEILASVSNATGYPNDNITNKISLELQQQIPLPIDFNYNLTLNINQDAIYITDNTTYSYANGKLVIDIADYLNKSDYQTQIKDIKSRINLARNHENPITISNFTTDNEFLIPLRKDGNITIYEVCLDSMRLIENYTPANIQTLNRTTIILNTYESGTYKIEISDLTGKVITKQTQTTKNSEQIKYNYELSTGTYIIKITEPGKIQTIKVIFVE